MERAGFYRFGPSPARSRIAVLVGADDNPLFRTIVWRKCRRVRRGRLSSARFGQLGIRRPITRPTPGTAVSTCFCAIERSFS